MANVLKDILSNVCHARAFPLPWVGQVLPPPGPNPTASNPVLRAAGAMTVTVAGTSR